MIIQAHPVLAHKIDYVLVLNEKCSRYVKNVHLQQHRLPPSHMCFVRPVISDEGAMLVTSPLDKFMFLGVA